MMKNSCVVPFFLLLVLAAPGQSHGASTNPIQKIIEMLSGMQAKVIADGEAEEKAYGAYFEWCDDASKEKQFAIKTATSEAAEQAATIQKADSDQESLSTKIEEFSSDIATNEADLKSATTIRKKEREDFAAAEAELMETIDALGRAIKILEKPGAAALLQSGKVQIKGLTEVLGLLVTSSGLALEDKSALMELMQTSEKSTDQSNDQESALEATLGAPAPAAYESKSGGIVSVLEDMLEKAESQLAEARKAESETSHNYDMLKQSLADQVRVDKREMDEAKKEKSASEETEATAAGELEITSKAMAEDQTTLKDIQMECMTQADEHEQAQKSRAEELKALATAKKIIQKMSAGLLQEKNKVGGEALLQLGESTRMRAGAGFEQRRQKVVSLVKKLGQRFQSMALVALAQELAEAGRGGVGLGADPFEKVKGLISGMIEKLLKEASEEAGQKAFCDKEMSETKASKAKQETIVEDLTTKIDEAEAKIAKLKEEVADLQKQLAELAQLQATMDMDRADQHEAFLAAKADLEQGLKGIQMALKVLRDYYAKKEEDSLLQKDGEGAFSAFMQQPKVPGGHKKSSGAASGVIGMLEVAESDFSKNLAETNASEETAQEEYETVSQDMAVTKTTKEQDVKYKTKERKSLEKFVSETTEDRSGVQTELDAVLEYYEKLKPQCISKPEPYEERKKRREAEIEGLKEALQILEGEAMLLQTGSSLRHLRGISRVAPGH